MARQSSGSGSKQDYRTPLEFLERCQEFLGTFTVDLAADKDNAVVPKFFDKEADSLKQDWVEATAGGYGWLNPPFGNIKGFSQKAAKESSRGAKLVMLVPIGITDWFTRFVLPVADVLLLKGRLSFDGKATFPKDLMLCVYDKTLRGEKNEEIFRVWDWRKSSIGCYF